MGIKQEIFKKLEEFGWKIQTEVIGEFERTILKMIVPDGRYVPIEIWYRYDEEMCNELLVQVNGFDIDEWICERVATLDIESRNLATMGEALEEAEWLAKKFDEVYDYIAEVKKYV